MADEQVKSKGERRYGDGPKIKAADRKGDTVETGTPKEQKTGGAAEANMKADPGPEGTEAAGTESVDVNGRHSSERQAMLDRQENERKDMHKRHEKEISDLFGRHETERGGKTEAA